MSRIRPTRTRLPVRVRATSVDGAGLNLIDVVVVGILVALVVRGWMRGFLREALGLAALVVGTILAFRLSTPLGQVVRAVAGTSPEVSRLIAGSILFAGVSIAGSVLGRIGGRTLTVLPGMPTINRIAGAALGAGAWLIVATLLFSVLTVLPLPSAVADPLSESRMVATLTDPAGAAQRTMDIASGDGVLGVVLRIDEIVGAPRIGDPGDEVVMIPPADGADLVFNPRQTVALRGMINRERVTGDLPPLAEGTRLDRIARQHALDMYETGRIAHVNAAGDGPSDRLDRDEIPHVVVAELIGLGASPDAVVQAWVRDERSHATLLTREVTRLGVAVYSGPSGLMVVMVAAG